jgi:hypothetical protein
MPKDKVKKERGAPDAYKRWEWERAHSGPVTNNKPFPHLPLFKSHAAINKNRTTLAELRQTRRDYEAVTEKIRKRKEAEPHTPHQKEHELARPLTPKKEGGKKHHLKEKYQPTLKSPYQPPSKSILDRLERKQIKKAKMVEKMREKAHKLEKKKETESLASKMLVKDDLELRKRAHKAKMAAEEKDIPKVLKNMAKAKDASNRIKMNEGYLFPGRGPISP